MIRAILLAVLLLAGCVQTSARNIDGRTIVVSGRGGVQHNASDVFAASIVRAARAANERGFEYFAVLNANSSTRTGAFVTPGHSSTTGTVQTFGNTATYQGQTTYVPGMVNTYSQPVMDMVVRLFHTGEIDPNTPGVFSTAEVLAAQQ